MSQHQEEMLDIVDQDDNVIKSLPRSVVYEQELFSQMRSIWMLIKNDQGQFWIPRRCHKRKILPGYLDGSVVGHVQAGESYEQALLREAQEEVGLALQEGSYKLLGKLTPKKNNTFCFAQVYECQMNDAPKDWNRDEFSQWSWMSAQELAELFKQGEKIKDTLPVILKEFYGCDV